MIYVSFDPFRDVAASGVTSNLIDSRDAFDLTLSIYTTAGSSSTFTYQLSNDSRHPDNVSATVGWSDWTTVFPSAATAIQPPLGFRWGRILRSPSGSSLVFAASKQVSTSRR